LVKPAGAHHSNRYGRGGSIAILAAVPSICPVDEIRFFPDAAAARRLRFEWRCGDEASALVCESVLLELLARGSTDDRPRRPSPPWLVAVEEILRSDATSAMSAIAARVGRDPVHLAREFRRHYG